MRKQKRLKKKEFRPNTIDLHLDDDMGLGQDITIRWWADPSREIIWDLIDIMGDTDEDEEVEPGSEEDLEREQRFFECVPLLIIDSDIEGLDFSTPDSCRAAFTDKRLPWGILYQATMIYMGRLISEYQVLKNALRRVSELSSSGNENGNEEEE